MIDYKLFQTQLSCEMGKISPDPGSIAYKDEAISLTILVCATYLTVDTAHFHASHS